MRLLHLIPTAGGGGAERQLGILAAAQVRRGHEVHVALLEGGANLERYLQAVARVHRRGAWGIHAPAQVLRLARLVRRLRPALVQSWLPRMDVVGGAAARLARVPWVLGERASALAYPPSAQSRLRRALARGADAVVANSAHGAAYWREARGPRTVAVVRNALDLRAIDAAPAAPRGGERPVVLFAGRLVRQKNVLALAEAARAVAAATPLRLVVCGEGPERQRLVATLAGAPGLVAELHGYRADLWSLMKGADVLATPSRFEGTPNVVLEAMACGCPVVASDIPEHREVLDEGCAWLAPTGRDGAYAAALADALARPY